ncbi:MAG: hypothetical protein J6L05_04405 [Ruminococcus sp.]|nr:hypothetical protein [Ruminococcus sp.]
MCKKFRLTGGNITDNLHFFTDKSFCCGKYEEFDNVRLYNIVGCDLAEKGSILQIISEILKETPQIIYYSPYEPQLPQAVYLPELNTLAASGYNICCTERLNSRTYDISSIISPEAAAVEEITGYTIEQSDAYRNKSLELIGIADLLLREYIKNGAELLKSDRVRLYAKKKISSILTAKASEGENKYRSVSAITCNGYRFTELPEDYQIIRLCDNYIAASSLFVRAAAREANCLGYDTVISRAADSESSPLHLIIPEAKTAFISESEIFSSRFSESRRLNLERFYVSGLMTSREHDISVFGGYVRKIYNEAILCARLCTDIKAQGRKLLMPFVSRKKAFEIASEIIEAILNRV